MLKKLKPYFMTEEEELEHEIASWAWNSHYWIETDPDYYQCKWCKMVHTGMMGIHKDFPLCKENPRIKKMIKEATETDK